PHVEDMLTKTKAWHTRAETGFLTSSPRCCRPIIWSSWPWVDPMGRGSDRIWMPGCCRQETFRMRQVNKNWLVIGLAVLAAGRPGCAQKSSPAEGDPNPQPGVDTDAPFSVANNEPTRQAQAPSETVAQGPVAVSPAYEAGEATP